MVTETSAGLWCPGGGFHIDPCDPVERAVITHAHGDHARPGSAAYLCAAPSARLLRRRFGSDARVEAAEYGHPLTIGAVQVSFHPAGHVLGSAQIRIESGGEVWVIAGDYKRAADPTCAAFEPVQCDTFVTESTFGLPIYRWDDTGVVVDDIAAWWNANRGAGRTSVLFCYTIGKAQRLLAELMRITDRPLYVHGMMLGMIDAYRDAGVHMLPVTPVIERPAARCRHGALRGCAASATCPTRSHPA
jgi:putative mRNA 3-end processing factor